MRQRLKDLVSSNQNLEKYFKLKNIFRSTNGDRWILLNSSTISIYELLIQSVHLLCINLKNYVETQTFPTSHDVKATAKWVLVQEHTSAKEKARGNFSTSTSKEKSEGAGRST